MRTTRIVFAKESMPISIPNPKSSLAVGEFLGLNSQEDYDVVGVVITTDGGHLWMVLGTEVKLVAIKLNKPRIQLQPFQLICVLDVSFMYFDPRHAFPVFLFSEQSQLILDAVRIPSTNLPGDERLLQEAVAFVGGIMNH
jgi:hypothetical protein